jgi:hypothetical protein
MTYKEEYSLITENFEFKAGEAILLQTIWDMYYHPIRMGYWKVDFGIKRNTVKYKELKEYGKYHIYMKSLKSDISTINALTMAQELRQNLRTLILDAVKYGAMIACKDVYTVDDKTGKEHEHSRIKVLIIVFDDLKKAKKFKEDILDPAVTMEMLR